MRGTTLSIASILMANAISVSASPPISIRDHQRVLTFSEAYHAETANGEIVVCRPPNTIRRGTCVDANNANAWLRMTDVMIPGHVLHAFQFSDDGNNNLRLLFRKP